MFKFKTKQDSQELNVVDSIVKAKLLYKNLIQQAHPDKHPGKAILAEELTKELNNNRYNYNNLLLIGQRIKLELLNK